MAIGDSAGILFRVRSEYDDKGMKAAKTDILGLASGLGSLAGPAAIAGTALVAIGAAAVTAGAQIYRLVQSTSEFGSAIFDASQQAGLGARTMSALKVAAEQSGSSLEKITGSVSKFSTLIGQAELGNEKANKTLERYGIVSRDTDKALSEAVLTIAKMTDGNKQSAAAAELFKDKTGEVLGVIKSFQGDLPGLIAELEKLGLVMSDQDAKAADEFGDQMDTLTAQIAATGREIGFAFMPIFLDMAKQVSGWLAQNKGELREWGTAFSDTFRGMAEITKTSTASSAADLAEWAPFAARQFDIVQQAAYATGVAIGHALNTLRQIGAESNAAQGLTASIGGTVGVLTGRDPAGGGGRGGGGGARGAGAAPRDNAESERRKAVQDAAKGVQDLLAIYQAGYAKRLAQLDFALALGETAEKEYIRDVQRIHLEGLLDEKRQNELLLTNERLNAEERLALRRKIAILDDKIAAQRLETATKIIKAIDKESAAEEQAHKERLRRAKELSDFKQQKALEYSQYKAREFDRQRRAKIIGGGDELGAFDQLNDFLTDSKNPLGATATTAAIAGVTALQDAFAGLAQAVGQVVQAWVLYGSAGQSVRQVTAQILAGVAAQAAVKAVFELAEGFAALAMAFFGIPNAGPSAQAHFTAAAIYGSIAGISAVAGRQVAGNAFNQEAGAATGGGSGGNQQQQNNNFGGRFSGYGGRDGGAMSGFMQQQAKINDRQNMVLGQLEETIHQLGTRLTDMSPGHVVTLAAEENPRAFRKGVENDLNNSGSGAMTPMRRAMGDLR